MAQIDKPNLHFNTVTFTGTNGSGQSITGVGFQPDWLWIKHRTDVSTHRIQDAVRGSTKIIASNSDAAESTSSNSVISFDSDGFTHGTNSAIDATGNVVAWNWKANGTGSANTDGSISSTVSANTTAGFSIVTYTGTGSNATVGHGLSSAPKVIIFKETNGTRNWRVYHNNIGNNKVMYLNTNSAEVSDTTAFNSTSPTSSVFSVGTSGGTNASSSTYIAYCFAEKKGFSKFGSYTGNGNANGTFVYTGFKPAFVISKNTSTTMHWSMNDTKRDPFNVGSKRLWPSQTTAETTNSAYYIDYLSNGFKIRSDSSSWNGSGNTMIYMAFAENPIVGSNNVAATAS